MRNKIKLLIFLCLALALTGCRSHKFGVKDLTGPTIEQARFESVVQNSFEYNALQSKVKYSLGSTSVSGKLCLESSNRLCLLVNAPLLGFEIARVEATQEQVLLVDKFDKVYSVLNLADLYHLDEISGHEMEVLECIMLGRIYIPGKGVATRRDFKSLTWSTPTLPDGTKGQSEGLYLGQNFSLLYAINAQGQLVSTRLTVGNKTALWEYADYRQVEKGKLVPTQEIVTATNAEQETVSAALTLTSPELGESSWRDFEPTGSYRQVTGHELMEIVKKMIK